MKICKYANEGNYQSACLLDEGALGAVVHFVIEAAGVAQIMAGAVATPQRRRNRTAVDAFAPLHLLVIFI